MGCLVAVAARDPAGTSLPVPCCGRPTTFARDPREDRPGHHDGGVSHGGPDSLVPVRPGARRSTRQRGPRPHGGIGRHGLGPIMARVRSGPSPPPRPQGARSAGAPGRRGPSGRTLGPFPSTRHERRGWPHGTAQGVDPDLIRPSSSSRFLPSGNRGEEVPRRHRVERCPGRFGLLGGNRRHAEAPGLPRGSARAATRKRQGCHAEAPGPPHPTGRPHHVAVRYWYLRCPSAWSGLVVRWPPCRATA
jgi:hypothetical protein